ARPLTRHTERRISLSDAGNSLLMNSPKAINMTSPPTLTNQCRRRKDQILFLLCFFMFSLSLRLFNDAMFVVYHDD
ncbi:MAG: hypothetical protein PHU58_07450, partial [Prevotella sp.]|nr:hypothetical protein [Prevotella sp.]